MSWQKLTENLFAACLRTLFVIAVLLLTSACSNGGDQKQVNRKKSQPMVKTAMAEVRSLIDRLELTGSIEPTRFARMASPIEGPVIACPVREGDRIRAGQLLTRLGRAKGDNAMAASARAELEREELELGRIEKLVETRALPGEELDKARVKVSETQAKLTRAMERLGDYRVSAPWSGVVSKVHVAVGDFVSARETLVELFDTTSLVLHFAVPEDNAARVKDGASIAVVLDAHPGKTFAAKVTRIYPDIDRRTHTRTVEGTIEGDVELVPGMFARLHLTLASAPEALTVPTESVVRRDGKPVLFVITNKGNAQQRPVKLGMEDSGRLQILEGLEKGELVATAGHMRLGDGMKVRLAKRQQNQAGKHRSKAAQAKGKAR